MVCEDIASFYIEAVKEIEAEVLWTKNLCNKYGVSPDWVSGYIKGMERSLQILKLPIFSKEGWV